MKKFSVKIVLILSFFALAAGASAHTLETRPKNVLILHTAEYGLPAYDLVVGKIRSYLRNRLHVPLVFYAEYLDIARFPDEPYQARLFEFYREKYGDKEIDLLIAAGPHLAQVFTKQRNYRLSEVPSIMLDFLPPASAIPYVFKHANMTGVFIVIDIERPVATILRVHPRTETLYVVTGASAVDRNFSILARLALRKHEKEIRVVHLNGERMDDVIRTLEAAPANSAVLLLSFLSDGDGVPYYTREAAGAVGARANAPVYVLFDTAIADGVVGGLVVDFEKVGATAADMARRLLEGENSEAVSPVTGGFQKFIFDWRQVRRWGIPEANLPEGSLLLYKGASFYERYKTRILAVLLFAAIQTGLVIYLFALNRKRKKLSADLLRSEDRYRQLMRIERSTRLGELVGSLSHELNQPLTAIFNGARAVLRFLKADRLDVEVLEDILQNIVEDQKRAASIVRNVRNMLKKHDHKKKTVEIDRIVDDVVAIFRSEASARHIEIKTRHEKKSPRVVGNGNQIRQVLLNLIMNAADAVSSNMIEDRKIVLTTRMDENSVEVSVRDFGRGIDRERIGNIFDPFFTTKTGGMGIGLAVCETIVRQHGGDIRACNNNDGGGATFAFKLPKATDGR